ncbi:MAG TPA: hypothetical protein ENI57_03005, partial [Ignavibacteria bacterium]|nr:hypothetical protein [Ignavibacteria bacterium]
MKKFTQIILFAIIISFAGCSSSSKISMKIKNINGIAIVVGNEPFTHIAIQVDSNTVYLIKSNPKIEHMLLMNQGKKIIVKYNKIENVEGNKVIHVVE